MKTKKLKKLLAGMAIVGLFFGLSVAPAQDNAAVNVAQPSRASSPAPQLSYGVPQILQLAQAKVSDDTIIAYIKSSGNNYGLTADQIIYLRQQGVSDAVLTAMLTQPRPANVMTPATPAPQPVAVTTGSAQVSVAPTVTYVQTVPSTTYYYQPYSYYPYYYPYYPSYVVYPSVSLSFGWGGSWGGYYRGGYYGGYHGGGYGGYHGGGYGGGHGGGHH